jgi:predicted DNA-binding transcriptional regulator AlpA
MSFKPHILALCHEDLLFDTPADRCRYIGLGVNDQPQWLEENPNRWWRIFVFPQTPAAPTERRPDIGTATAQSRSSGSLDQRSESKWRRVPDVREKTAQRPLRDDAVMKVDPDSSSSRSNTRDSESCVAKAAIEPPLTTAPSRNATMPARETPLKVDALPAAIVENVVTINGRAYITTEQFAAILGVSERTLHRLFEDGKGPPKIKIAGVFYELDEVLKWTADQGRPIKRTAFVDNDDKE